MAINVNSQRLPQDPVNRRWAVARDMGDGRRGTTMWMVVAVWITLVASGMWLLWDYEHTAGVTAESPQAWPAESQLKPSENRFTLLMFAHPKCPCTRASIGELSRLMADSEDRIEAYAVFVKPEEFEHDSSWEKSDLWMSAQGIPGVTAVCDLNGIEAGIFQAATSGYAVLFDSNGARQFQGGITSSRGHSGDSLGRSAIIDLVTNGSAEFVSTQVFGCELGSTLEEPCQSCCQQ